MKHLPCLLGAIALITSSARAQNNWPQFRGPHGDGIAEAKDLPLTWDDQHNVKWKAAIHDKGWSSPVIWGNQIWMTTATADGHQLFAVCVDKETGKTLFDIKVFNIAQPQYCIPFNSYASPTPCIEDGRVYVTFGAPGTAGLNTRTGKILWTRTDFVCNHYRGAGSSPLLYRDRLFMNFDGSDYQYVVALDKQTGRTLWRTDRSIDYGDLGRDGKPIGEGDFRKAFSTPRIFTVDGHDQLVSLASKAIYAYEPETGKELWRVEVKSSFSGSDTPVFADGLIFFTTGPGNPELLAIRPGGHGVLSESSIVWRTHKRVPSRSSLIVADGLLYMVSDSGIASCLEARTGKEIWHERIDGNYSASPIFAAGRIYFPSEQGLTTVIEAGKEYKLLAKNALGPGFMASPAVSGGTLFLRSRTDLYRIEP